MALRRAAPGSMTVFCVGETCAVRRRQFSFWRIAPFSGRTRSLGCAGVSPAIRAPGAACAVRRDVDGPRKSGWRARSVHDENRRCAAARSRLGAGPPARWTGRAPKYPPTLPAPITAILIPGLLRGSAALTRPRRRAYRRRPSGVACDAPAAVKALRDAERGERRAKLSRPSFAAPQARVPLFYRRCPMDRSRPPQPPARSLLDPPWI